MVNAFKYIQKKLRDKKFWTFTLMIHGVFIPPQPYRFQRKEWLKNPLLLVTLIKDKYLLYIINEIVSVIGPFRDLLYIYEYIKIIISYMNDSYNCSKWRGMIVYYTCITFNLGDYLEPDI
jgi:hypothetical protein